MTALTDRTCLTTTILFLPLQLLRVDVMTTHASASSVSAARTALQSRLVTIHSRLLGQ